MAKGNQLWIAGGIVLLAFVVIGFNMGWFSSLGFAPEEQQTVVAQQTAVTEAALKSYACPDTQNTVLTVNVMNSEDSTASTEMATPLYIYQVIDGVVQTDAFTSVADSSGATATIPCGEDWMIRVLSGNNYEGAENSKILSVTGDSSAVVQDGDIYFSTSGSYVTLTANGKQNGVLQFQVYDEQSRAYLNEDGNTDSTGYQDYPAAFEGTANGIELAVGTQGQIELYVNFRTNETKREFNDRGYYISVNASTATYDIPTLRLDGETLTNVKGSLDEYCARSYSGEEYVYFADRDVPNSDKGQLYFSMFALSGVNPANSTDDISITWHSIGTYSSISGSGALKVGACDDTSSTAAVHTAQTVSVDIS